MGYLLTLDDLQLHFELAREKLSFDRRELLSLAPLPENFCRDAYSFTYMRAERFGLSAIEERLKEVSWLPMQLDPQSEIILENKTAMKKWLSAPLAKQPDSLDFGNDFIHVLTRVALTKGWESSELHETTLRICGLFRDLSCLIGLIYYGVWMAENGILSVPVSDPLDLGLTAKELSYLTHSPEVARFLSKRRHAPAEKASEKRKSGPSLRVIENSEWSEPPSPLAPL